MVDEFVKELVVKLNPQWKHPVDFAEGYKPRAVFDDVYKLAGERQVLALCGLRRTGKTTLLKKIMAELAKTNPARSLLYFSFENFSGKLLDVVWAYEELHGEKPKFLFLDEVQKLSNWAEQVKLVYDMGGTKIFVTGSETLFVRKGLRESLAGRIYEFEVKPLSFKEFLVFTGGDAWLAQPELYASELDRAFNAYLLSSGFPELIGQADPELVRQYVKSAVVEKIVFLDVAKLYGVQDPAKLVTLVEILIANPGMLVNSESLARDLGVTRQTLSAYLTYLEYAHLLVKLYNYSKNKITSYRRLKKYYPTFFTPALLDSPDAASLGKLVETACVVHANARFFWRDKYKNEVDLILTKGNKTVPVEVKYRNDARATKALAKFTKKYACDEAVLVTKNTRGTLPTTPPTRLIPAREFLLNT